MFYLTIKNQVKILIALIILLFVLSFSGSTQEISPATFRLQFADLQFTGNMTNQTSLLGLTDNMKWNHFNLISQFFIGQQNGVRGTAFKTGADRDFGALKLDTSFSHSEQNFYGANGLGQGQNILNFNMAYSPNKEIQTLIRFQDIVSMNSSIRINEENLVLNPYKTTKISVDHSATDTNGFGISMNIEVDKVNLEQNIGSKTKAVVSMQNTDMNTIGTNTQSQVKQISLQSNYVNGILIQANMQSVQINSSVGNNQQTQKNINLVETPSKRIKLSQNFSVSGDNDQDTTIKGAILEISPLNNTKLSLGYIATDSSGVGIVNITSSQYKVGLDLPVLKTGKLSMDFCLNKIQNDFLNSNRTYGLRYQHPIRSNLILSLSENYVQYLQMGTTDQINTQINFNLKF